MDIRQALADLGVTERSLSDPDRQSLDARGYVLLPHLLLPRYLADMRASYERLMKQEGKPAFLSNLPDKAACFDVLFTHHKILAAVNHLMKKEFRLASLTFRDGSNEPSSEGVHVLGMVDDFAADNGAPMLRETLLTGEAGSVVVFDGRLSIADSPKKSERKRRGLFAGFSGQGGAWSPDTVARIAAPAKFILNG